MSYRSEVNKPDAYAFNSDDDVLNPLTGTYSALRIQPPNPILGVHKALLAKAVIPLPATFPDYSLCFWYYIGATLRCARLFPWQAAGLETGTRARAYNRRFTSIQEVVDALIFASLNDSFAENPYYVQGQLVYNFDATTFGNRIIVSSSTAGFRVANYDDPAITTAFHANQIRTNGVVIPFVPGVNLNQRLGYSRSMSQGQYPVRAANTPMYPDGNLNLQYSNFVHVCSSLVMGSFFGARGLNNVLGVVPLTPNPLTHVTSYQATQDIYVRCTPDNYILNFDLRDDNGQPIVFPDSTPVSLHVQFQYTNA